MPTILQDLSSKSEESEGEEGRKGGREEKEDRNQLKLSSFRYHRNCFPDYSKLQLFCRLYQTTDKCSKEHMQPDKF